MRQCGVTAAASHESSRSRMVQRFQPAIGAEGGKQRFTALPQDAAQAAKSDFRRRNFLGRPVSGRIFDTPCSLAVIIPLHKSR